MKNILILYIFIFVGVGCEEKLQLSKEILLFQQSSVILPEQYDTMFNALTGKVSDNVNTGLKYVIYSNSLACTSCMINNLVSWNSLIEYGKNFNKEIGFYFIFSPERKYLRSINMLIQHSEFKYQIIVDEKKYFEKLNPYLPKDHLLHTFLLDENNRVILVGNPLHNKKIKEMFYKIVEEKLGKPGEVAVKED